MNTRVLVVDDSPTARLALRRALGEGTGIDVVGEASSGPRALDQVRALKPDLVTMDVQLGDDDGVEVARQIMTTSPTPILVVTALDPRSARLPFRIIEAGALGIAAKPPARGHPEHERETERLRRLVRSLAGVPVVTRRRRPDMPRGDALPRKATPGLAAKVPPPADGLSVVAIGASTGGPPVIAELLASLPMPFPLPILIVQHIEPGFVAGMADWLCSTGHRVTCLSAPVPLEAGRVHLAGDGMHLGLLSPTMVGPVAADGAAFCPSVDALFSSVARHAGPAAMGVLLGGMGRDGARGLLELRQAGGRTIAQEPSTCIVDGMPRAAIDAGAVDVVLTPAAIAASLTATAQSVGRRPAPP